MLETYNVHLQFGLSQGLSKLWRIAGEYDGGGCFFYPEILSASYDTRGCATEAVVRSAIGLWSVAQSKIIVSESSSTDKWHSNSLHL
jgi:hypothetical protein